MFNSPPECLEEERKHKKGGSSTNVSKPTTPSNMSSLTNSINSALKAANLPKLN
jgi:hypothetical protein